MANSRAIQKFGLPPAPPPYCHCTTYLNPHEDHTLAILLLRKQCFHLGDDHGELGLREDARFGHINLRDRVAQALRILLCSHDWDVKDVSSLDLCTAENSAINSVVSCKDMHCIAYAFHKFPVVLYVYTVEPVKDNHVLLGQIQLVLIDRWLLYRGRLQCFSAMLVLFQPGRLAVLEIEVAALHSDHLRQVPLCYPSSLVENKNCRIYSLEKLKLK